MSGRSRERSARWGALAVLVVLGSWSSAASAQPKVEVKTAPQEEPSEARKEAARGMFRVALEAFKGGRFQEALDKLEEVYKLDPNPIILYNIGRALEELGRLAEAAEYFQRAVADPALPEQLQAEVGRRLPKVLPVLKFRESRLASSQNVALGVVRAKDASRQEAQRLEEARKPKVVQEPPGLAERPLFWGGVGASALGAGLLVGGFLIDQGLSDPIEELKDPETRQSAARTRALQSEIESDQLLATIFYVSGGVLLAGGGTLLYFAIDGTFDTPPEGEEGSVYVLPALLDGGAGVSLGGSF